LSATRGVRLCVTGATGALGTEVLAALDAVRLPIAQLLAVAGERSLGTELDFQGELVPATTELPALHGLDLVIHCGPAAAAPDVARAALRAEVPCIDCSGAFAQRSEVPLGWGARGERAPLLATPVDAALIWLPLLHALVPLGAIASVRATVLEGASASGRAGIEALTRESLALFNSQELSEEESPGPPLAFDCRPTSGERAAGGGRAREAALAAVLARVLDPAPAVSARWIQVPVFVGQFCALTVTWDRRVDAAEAARQLAKAPGVELWEAASFAQRAQVSRSEPQASEDHRVGERSPSGVEGPNLRAVAGRDVVVTSHPEPDTAEPRALFLWAAGDVLCLAAANAAALAAALVAERGAH
jgi:aspartate-semialdehyde dehydrogenase